jgi:hypothetical protein
MRGYCPFPAHPNADQDAQTNLYAYQRGDPSGGGHGDGDALADGHPLNQPDGYACACRYGHACAHRHAATHRHPCADQAAGPTPSASTNGYTGTPSPPTA